MRRRRTATPVPAPLVTQRRSPRCGMGTQLALSMPGRLACGVRTATSTPEESEALFIFHWRVFVTAIQGPVLSPPHTKILALDTAPDDLFGGFAFGELANTVPTLLFVASADGRAAYVNRQWLAYTGAADAQSLEAEWGVLVHPDDHAALAGRWEAARGDGDAFEAQFRLRNARGEFLWHLIRMKAVLGAGGEVSLWAGVVTEIEQQKRATLALDRREREFRTLVENSPDGVTRLDRQLRFVYANEAVARCFDRPCTQLVGHTFEEAGLPGVAAAALRPAALLALAQNEAQRCEFTITDGARNRHYVCRLIPEADRVDHVDSVLCIFYDITRQQAALEALRESEHRFAQFANSSDDVFWIADADRGELLYVSPAFESLWGVSVEALKADPAKWNQGVITPAPVLLPLPFYRPTAAAGDKEPVREYRVRRPDGTPVWVRDRRFHLHTRPGGEVTCIGGIVEDITERKVWDTGCEVVLALEREARREAEAQASAKDEFLAVVSHELRSPLNAIRGWAHVLRQTGELTHSQLRMLDAIDRNTQAQAQLVDDMLDTQRLLRGKIKLELKPSPLAPLVEQAVDVVRPAAAAKQIALRVHHGALVDAVHADPDRLRQAVVNLLSNAVKFTPDLGRVEVATGRRDSTVVISVTDTGIGIEPALLPRIFDPFRQAADASTRRQSGLGLGLALARQLVELHGGSLKARSAGPGEGATFTIELPVGRHNGTSAGEAAGRPDDERLASQLLAGCRIAIVDDDVEARQILELLLGRHQARTVAFSSVAAVYAYLETVSAEHQPQVLISDIAMPDEDGYSLLRRVRALEQRHARRSPMICVALTAFVTDKDRDRALAAGFDEHIGKPVDPKQLVVVVNKLLQSKASDVPP